MLPYLTIIIAMLRCRNRSERGVVGLHTTDLDCVPLYVGCSIDVASGISVSQE